MVNFETSKPGPVEEDWNNKAYLREVLQSANAQLQEKLREHLNLAQEQLERYVYYEN